MGVIYCLFSTRDGIPRYVGQTEYSGKKRRDLHVTKALDRQSGLLYDWIRNEWREGFDVDYWTLQDDIIPADLEMYEMYWIEQFDSLLNVRPHQGNGTGTSAVGRRVTTDILRTLRGQPEEDSAGH